jgi:hypothetical protein
MKRRVFRYHERSFPNKFTLLTVNNLAQNATNDCDYVGGGVNSYLVEIYQ